MKPRLTFAREGGQWKAALDLPTPRGTLTFSAAVPEAPIAELVEIRLAREGLLGKGKVSSHDVAARACQIMLERELARQAMREGVAVGPSADELVSRAQAGERWAQDAIRKVAKEARRGDDEAGQAMDAIVGVTIGSCGPGGCVEVGGVWDDIRRWAYSRRYRTDAKGVRDAVHQGARGIALAAQAAAEHEEE